MCGIAGIIGRAAEAPGRARVARMMETLRHRGPDDAGAFAADGIAFGMRRLSIIDLAGGHQPMWSERGTGIVFNGEIYNYRDLRAALEQRGHRFATQSDTEVILRLYDEEGIACLARLDGMFAICLYDPRRGRVFLARDRLGKKPLYYGEIGGAFYFASELKAIIAVLDERPAIDRQVLHHYLTLRCAPGPDSIWQGIRKLEPATYLEYDLARGSATTARYWSLAFHSKAEDPGFDYPRAFEERFLAAVQKRLVASDVPVGILLSGGLDSSAVAAAAFELGHRSLHSFSVAFDEGDADERHFARQAAARLGTQHHEVVIDQKQFLALLPELVHVTDEPLADLAAIPLHAVARLAREEVKVVLSGEGADEILAGYDLDVTARRLDRLKTIARFLPRGMPRLPGRRGAILGDLAHAGWSRLLAARATHMTNLWSEDEKARLWRDKRPLAATDALIRAWYEAAPSPQPIDQFQQVHCGAWLVEDLLMKADKVSMAHSLELRCPFLDHALVEWCARLPLAWKVGSAALGYSSKRILRRFAAPRLPEAIITRPKQGFPVPAYRWLEAGLGAWAEDRLLRGGRLDSFFNMAPAVPVIAAARRGSSAAQHKVWTLLVLDHWLERWQCG
jgi:asparagine synthase (glutamine-hydrolysing)